MNSKLRVETQNAKGKSQNNNSKLKTDLKTDLKKRAYFYALDVVKLIGTLNKDDFAVETIGKQLLRSVTSVGANIVEARAGSTRRDFTNFYNHALKSANESKFWLGLLRDSGKTSRTRADGLLKETTELANILGSSVLTLKGKKKF